MTLTNSVGEGLEVFKYPMIVASGDECAAISLVVPLVFSIAEEEHRACTKN